MSRSRRQIWVAETTKNMKVGIVRSTVEEYLKWSTVMETSKGEKVDEGSGDILCFDPVGRGKVGMEE